MRTHRKYEATGEGSLPCASTHVRVAEVSHFVREHLENLPTEDQARRKNRGRLSGRSWRGKGYCQRANAFVMSELCLHSI